MIVLFSFIVFQFLLLHSSKNNINVNKLLKRKVGKISFVKKFTILSDAERFAFGFLIF